ncbi:MAG: Na+/H+ antiporter [Ktedonobacterales bacterium]
MQSVELVLGLMVMVVALVTIARKLALPYPVLLVGGGLALGFVPGLPSVALQPDLVFLLFLPPLIFRDALTASFHDLRANLRAIWLLAVVLVLVTTAVVAVVAHAAIPQISLAQGFVLGAIIAPTEVVPAMVILERLGVPRRVSTVVEGEGLINDATAIVVYGVAVTAVLTGTFSMWQAGLRFLFVSIGGIIVGLAAGWCVGQVRRRLSDPPVENTISLLSPFAAYVPAAALGVSGVLAVVTIGLYLGRLGPRVVSAQARLQAGAMWDIVVFLLNGLIFILIGLQLHSVIGGLSAFGMTRLVWYGVLVSLTVMLVRLVWVFATTYLPQALSERERESSPYRAWRHVFVVGWTGMRGIVSLAVALSLPEAFPQRQLLLFLTFCVIFATLVVQGLSLPMVIKRLGVADDGIAEREENKARYKASMAALARLDALATEDNAPQDLIDHLRAHYQEKSQRFGARYHGTTNEQDEAQAKRSQRIERELIAIERDTLIDLRNRGVINDEVMRRVQLDLDLEVVRLRA